MSASEASASGARWAILPQKQPFHEVTFCSVGDQTQGPEALYTTESVDLSHQPVS